MRLRNPLALALLAAPAVAQAPAMTPTPAAGIPVPRGVAHDVVDGTLWAMGSDWKASFDGDGATFIPFLGSDAPRNFPVELRLEAASIGGRALPLTETATVSREGDTIVLDRGSVIVRYHLAEGSMEQTFELAELPLAPEGDLVVRVATSSELVLEDDGAGMRFAGERGGVRYGAATVLDGAGRAEAVESSRAGGEISIRVPRAFLERAVHPVVVDPLLSTWTITDSDVMFQPGDLAFDPISDRYLYAYMRSWSAMDRDVITCFGDRDGNVFGGYWIFISDSTFPDVEVANDASTGSFLIVARQPDHDDGDDDIFGRIRHIDGTIGPVLDIAVDPNVRFVSQAVGGDSDPQNSSGFLVGWVNFSANDHNYLEVRRVFEDGTLGPVQTVAEEIDSDFYFGQLDISRSAGRGLPGVRRWNLAWTYGDSPQDVDIWGAQVDLSGAVATGPFVVDSTSERHLWPVVAPPLDAPDGGPRDFLCVYGEFDETLERDLVGRLFKGSDFQRSYDLSQMEAEAAGGDTSWLDLDQDNPEISVDGAQIVIGYMQEGPGNLDEVYLSTWRMLGSELICTEPHIPVLEGDIGSWELSIVSEHECGEYGSTRLTGVYMYGQQGYAELHGFAYEMPAGYVDLGEVTCAGMPNSTGYAGTFRAYGSSDVADNSLYLDVDNLPPFQSGMFIMSQTSQVTPFGDGFLCLGSPVVRLNQTAGNSWVTGMHGAQVDLTSLPPAGVLQPGSTWYFQYWHRDVGGAFNFSNSLRIEFD